MDAVGPSPDLRISLEPRAIARRLAIPAAFAVIAAAALVIAGGPLQTFADALGRALDADPRWVVAAVGFELASFAGYVLAPLAGRRPRLPADEPPREHPDHARRRRRHAPAAHGRRRRGGPDALDAEARRASATQEAARTLFAFLVMLYSVFLGAIAISGGLLATRCRRARAGPSRSPPCRAPLAALAIVRVPRARLPRPRRRPTPCAPAASAPCALGRAARRRRRAGRPRHAAPARSARPRGVRLVDLRRRRPVGDAPRVRRTALDRRGRARRTSSARPATRCRSRAP